MNWLIKPVWIFWIERLTQVRLGDDLYGRYFVAFNFALLFNILLDFGINNYVSSHIAKDRDPGFIRPILRFRIGLAGAYILLVLALGIWQRLDPAILGLVVLNQVLAGFVLFFRSILQGKHLFRSDSIISVTDRLIAIVICAAFIYSMQFNGPQGLMLFLGAQSVGYAFALGLSVWFSRTALASPREMDPGFQKILKQTAWFAAMAFAMSVFTRVDAVMIRNLSPEGFAEAGLYARGFRLLDAALIFSALMSSQLLPIFAGLLNRKENVKPIIGLSSAIVGIVGILAGVVSLLYGYEIMAIVYKPHSAAEAIALHRLVDVFVLLMLAFLPMGLVHVFGTFLTAAGKLKFLTFSAVGCMVLNIGLNFYFIPKAGASGAAFCTLVTQTVFVALCIVGTVGVIRSQKDTKLTKV